MKKGFTLIELLSVIVILAIIALIATPIVLSIVNNTRESAAVRSADNYVDAVEQAIAKENIEKKFEPISCTKHQNNDTLVCAMNDGTNQFLPVKVKGKSPKTATLAIENGKVVNSNSVGITTTIVLFDKAIGINVSGNADKWAYKCVRGSNLHTEICNSSSNCVDSGYTLGETISYGNLGIKGSNLESGDILNCDINGDGIYNDETERFYYVSDYYNTTTKAFDSSRATLIYYTNVSGSSSTNSMFKYYDVFENMHGPSAAKLHLPKVKDWPNITLANSNRAILGETDEIKLASYSYAGYSARLLTSQEIKEACPPVKTNLFAIGGLDSCQYLMENTQYSDLDGPIGFWLETPNSTNQIGAWIAYGSRGVYYTGVANLYGVRPAIDVLKTDIEY